MLKDETRHALFGRILPTVFVGAVLDLENHTEREIGQALRSAYIALRLIDKGELERISEKDAARFKPKGKCISLARNTAQDMRDFDAKGTDESDFRIMPARLFKVLTRTPILTAPAERYGKYIRGVIIEPCGTLANEDIEKYLREVIQPDKDGAIIMLIREEHQRTEAERKRTRDDWQKRQAAHRERVKEGSANAPRATRTGGSEKGAAAVANEETARVAVALQKRHPKKEGNEKKLERAVAVALRKIGADELIQKHDYWVAKQEQNNTEERYYPALTKWLYDCKWKDAPKEKPIARGAGCGECGVEIV